MPTPSPQEIRYVQSETVMRGLEDLLEKLTEKQLASLLRAWFPDMDGALQIGEAADLIRQGFKDHVLLIQQRQNRCLANGTMLVPGSGRET